VEKKKKKKIKREEIKKKNKKKKKKNGKASGGGEKKKKKKILKGGNNESGLKMSPDEIFDNDLLTNEEAELNLITPEEINGTIYDSKIYNNIQQIGGYYYDMHDNMPQDLDQNTINNIDTNSESEPIVGSSSYIGAGTQGGKLLKKKKKLSKKSHTKKRKSKKKKLGGGPTGGWGSDFAATLASRGPYNYPDKGWHWAGEQNPNEKLFRAFNKTSTYIPNSVLSNGAAQFTEAGPLIMNNCDNNPWISHGVPKGYNDSRGVPTNSFNGSGGGRRKLKRGGMYFPAASMPMGMNETYAPEPYAIYNTKGAYNDIRGVPTSQFNGAGKNKKKKMKNKKKSKNGGSNIPKASMQIGKNEIYSPILTQRDFPTMDKNQFSNNKKDCLKGLNTEFPTGYNFTRGVPTQNFNGSGGRLISKKNKKII